ncbi:MAG: RraA family protein [Thermoleophilia bacterium]|nr:RraA family protein [Thermoleophilia bacterium]MDH5333555.1 RraA family protein [Thermoleophilia bacterium]
MLEQPPVLTIRRRFDRPPAELVAGFARAESAQVADAQGGGGALDARIQALPAIPFERTIAGPALTCETGPADVLAAVAALDVAQPGDVLLIATGGWLGTASIGDLFAAAARNAGIAAIVTDGAVRDVDGLARAGVPVFAAGLTPASPASSGPGTIGLPVVIGGRHVDAGDVVVCDRTGIVVVPRTAAAGTLAALERVLTLEAEQAERVAAGQVVPDAISELLASDRVREVD